VQVSAFGLDIASEIALPGRWRLAGAGDSPLAIAPASREEVRRRWSGIAQVGWRGRADGRELVVEEGRAGDVRFHLEPAIELHLSDDGGRLLVGDPDEDRAATMRLLLDSALFTVSLRRGHEALHAACVATDHGVLAVAGPTGAGKSSTLLALIAAGSGFYADDVLVLRRTGDAIVTAPGPPVLTAPKPVAAGVGEAIADLGDEVWLAVTGADAELPLAGIMWLDAPGTADPDWRRLLAQLLRYPRTPERERKRFELAADLAAAVPMLRLDARSAPPAALASRALAWLPSPGAL
jgi:hypothetical protein